MKKYSLLPIAVAAFAVFVFTLIVAGPSFAHDKMVVTDNGSTSSSVQLLVNDIVCDDSLTLAGRIKRPFRRWPFGVIEAPALDDGMLIAGKKTKPGTPPKRRWPRFG